MKKNRIEHNRTHSNADSVSGPWGEVGDVLGHLENQVLPHLVGPDGFRGVVLAEEDGGELAGSVVLQEVYHGVGQQTAEDAVPHDVRHLGVGVLHRSEGLLHVRVVQQLRH